MALVLAALQAALLVALRAREDPPTELPSQTLPRGARLPLEELPAADTDRAASGQGPRRYRAEELPAADTDRAAVEALDRLFRQRLAEAEARGLKARPPPEPILDAALANPDPAGSNVAALIEAWRTSLAAIGQTLDATSTRASGASPAGGYRPPGAP